MRGRAVVPLLTAAAATALASGPAPAVTGAARHQSVMSRQVDAVLARMTLREKVGQMFVSEVYGQSATTTDPADVAANRKLYGTGVTDGTDLLRTYHLGGVIYFAWSDNLANPRQIAALSDGLQRAATADPDGVPVQISTDQEGGVVNRVGAPLAASPGNMAVGATFSPRTARETAHVSGTELRALGVNTDDAPVVDVNTDPANSADGPRSFGDDPAAVSALAAAAVRGYQSAGVAAQAKHFPGLGDTTVNTDDGVAVTHRSRAEIMAEDIPPFRAAIGAGVKSIMAAHIVAPALDPSGLPAGLSRPIVTGLLRDTLHYDGVVVTDSLSAAAVAAIPRDRMILDAVNAGDDELLMPADLPAAVDTVLTAVRNGTLPTARIDRSVRRILRMKYELGLFTDPRAGAEAATDDIGTPAHLGTMADAARHAVTLVRDADHTLPLTAGSGRHVLVTGWGASATADLAADLAARGVAARSLCTGPTGPTGEGAVDAAVAAARTDDVTIVTTYNAWSDPGQQRLVTRLLATGGPVVVVAVGGPYDLARFPSAPAYLATYGYQPVSMAALADILLGAPSTGRLPVTVPTADGGATLLRRGSGLGSGR